MMRAGERQVAPTTDGIRRDHLARYEFAAAHLGDASRVIDAACGVGYGSNILAQSGHTVLGLDIDNDALEYAREHYRHKGCRFRRFDASNPWPLDPCDAAICFETIEHVEDPVPLLKALHSAAPRLLCSVPNEEVFPYNNHAYHFRHYTQAEFAELLRSAGWTVIEWWGQEGPFSEVEKNCMGRTLVAVAERIEEVDETSIGWHKPRFERPAPPILKVPESVAILGLGPSLHTYMDFTRRLGSRHKLAEETWAINALGDVFNCDRVFHMDDVRIQQIRAAAAPESNIAAMLGWLKTTNVPIYTSWAHPDYPSTFDFPLQDVCNDLGYAYFNNTAAYAVAYAIHIGVKKIGVYGCDYTYPNAHDAEKGRGCLEFWLGFASARGIKLTMPKTTSLLDALESDARHYYGYDALEIKRAKNDDGSMRFSFLERPRLPTAEEIEAAYDHTVHPNALVDQ